MGDKYEYLLLKIYERIVDYIDIKKLSSHNIHEAMETHEWEKLFKNDVNDKLSKICNPKHLYRVTQKIYTNQHGYDFSEDKLVGIFLSKNEAKAQIIQNLNKMFIDYKIESFDNKFTVKVNSNNSSKLYHNIDISISKIEVDKLY